MFLVAEDKAGLRMAADELLEESLHAPQRESALRSAERTADPQETAAMMLPARKLAVGYYLWLDYVAENIEPLLQAGIRVDEAHLSAEELGTLTVLREARADFRAKHPPCRGCGKLLENEWDRVCGACSDEERRK